MYIVHCTMYIFYSIYAANILRIYVSYIHILVSAKHYEILVVKKQLVLNIACPQRCMSSRSHVLNVLSSTSLYLTPSVLKVPQGSFALCVSVCFQGQSLLVAENLLSLVLLWIRANVSLIRIHVTGRGHLDGKSPEPFYTKLKSLDRKQQMSGPKRMNIISLQIL